MNRRPRLVTAALAAALVATLAACGGGEPSGSAETGASRQDTVIIGTTTAVATLDPAAADDVQNDLTIAAMYDKLVTYDADGALVPQLATAWKYNDDATAVTLTIRDDATFHDGTKLTATDVVHTLDRIKKLGIGVASFLSSYTSATATDATTVDIALSKTDTTFVGALSKVYVLNSALVAKNAGSDDAQGWLASNDAGSGPYTMTAYTPGQTAQFTRVADSWRFDKARPESLTYRYITDSGTLRSELQAGGVDIATGLNTTDLTAAKSIAGVEAVTLPSYMQLYVMMNTSAGITKDPRVREAIQLAYDYAGHEKSILGPGNGTIATGIAAPNLACRQDFGESTQDVAKAKQLIADAGVEGSSVTLAFQTIPEHAKAATLLQSNLKAIGLNVEPKPVTFPEYSSMVTDPSKIPDLALLWDFPYYPEIGPMLYRVYDSKFIGQTNYAAYSNPKVDKLLETGVTSTDPDTACKAFVDAQKAIYADHVSANISNPAVTTMVRDGIGGITFDPTYQLFNPTQLVIEP